MVPLPPPPPPHFTSLGMPSAQPPFQLAGNGRRVVAVSLQNSDHYRRMWWSGGTPPAWLVFCGPVILNVRHKLYTWLACFIHWPCKFQIGFGFYPVVVKYFANQGENRANAYVFTFYRYVPLTHRLPLIYLMGSNNWHWTTQINI